MSAALRMAQMSSRLSSLARMARVKPALARKATFAGLSQTACVLAWMGRGGRSISRKAMS